MEYYKIIAWLYLVPMVICVLISWIDQIRDDVNIEYSYKFMAFVPLANLYACVISILATMLIILETMLIILETIVNLPKIIKDWNDR